MIRVAAAWPLAALLSAQLPASMTTDDARRALLAAEDGRIAIPDTLRTPAMETLRTRQAEDLRVVMLLARSSDPLIKPLAIRTLGRYERRELTGEILQYLDEGPRAEVAFALAQSLRGPALPGDAAGEQVRVVQEALIVWGDRAPYADGIGAIARAVARLPYTHAAQAQAADAFLSRLLTRLADPEPRMRAVVPELAAAAESFVRLHGRLAPLGDDPVEWLRRIVKSIRITYDPAARAAAMQALTTARRLDEESVRIAAATTGAALVPLRRLAAVAAGGAGSPLAPAERTTVLLTLLEDASPVVRIEALRGWARHETAVHGCGRIVDAATDRSTAVAVVAIDLLAEACRNDVDVTDRLAALARTPPAAAWHRESHALVALARRAPEKVLIPLVTHVRHPQWQVRLYAARTAAIVDNVPILERFALDAEDNVREAVLAPLRRLKGNEAEPHLLAALLRDDDQLLRTAALQMKGLPPSPALAGALADALRRVSAERRETSRDARLALLDRLGELGSEQQSGAIVPLLRDFDIPVAMAAADLLTRWTGRVHEADPQLLARPPLPTPGELADASRVTIEIRMASGDDLELRLMPEVAPLTSVRFLRLVRQGYYDGLTFHRVVPNFVIQGGSPGANEYAGDAGYARDEISPAMHTAMTVGLSTRGRDTGDMQFFVNLIDNTRLDGDYTVFARVVGGHPAEVLEGGVMRRIVARDDADERRRNAAIR